MVNYIKKHILPAAVLLLVCLPICLAGCGARIEWGDKVYSTSSFAGDSVYYADRDGLYCVYSSEPGKVYRACIDPLCRHYYPECEAAPEYMVTSTLVVKPEGRALPFVYMIGPRRLYTVEGGENKPLDSSEQRMDAVRVFDTATGKSRNVAYTEIYGTTRSIFFDGKIYMSGGDGRIGSVDAGSGECAYLDGSTRADLIGIMGGRIYMKDSGGRVYSCEADFSDLREVYDCGFESVGKSAYVDSGVLYFERNVKDVSDINAVISSSDVYAVRLDDIPAGESLVAKGVLEWMPGDGALYYNIYEYKEYGEVTVGGKSVVPRSYDSGVIYRYDAGTKKSEACVSLDGVSAISITDAADGKILFEGWRYRELDDVPDDSFYEAMCIADTDTGEWSVLSHSRRPE